MIAWPAKDPSEDADFVWLPTLDTDDTIATFTATVVEGTVIADADPPNSGTSAVVWISGGVAGETARIDLRIVTTFGRTFEETAVLPIVERGTSILAEFRLRYPAFAAVGDGPIAYWIGQASSVVGDNWPSASRTSAKLAWAAHKLVETGALPSAIPAGLTEFKSGNFSAKVADSVAGAKGLHSTVYGLEFLALRRTWFAGPIMAWTTVPDNA